MSQLGAFSVLRRLWRPREVSKALNGARRSCCIYQLPAQRHVHGLPRTNWSCTVRCWNTAPPSLAIAVRQFHDYRHELTSLVGEYLDRSGDAEVKGRQIRLLSSILEDVSKPTKMLIAKLNCETKLSAEEVYALAVGVFQAKDSVGEDVLEMAAALFQYSGEQGDTNALYTYAQLLRTGQGTETDLSQATQLFSDLAMKGHPYAQFALAGMYYTGSGVEQNFTRAYSLYSVASQNYVAEAFNVLGTMHQHGQGVEENMEEAVKHYTSGAELGDPMAHLSLASCYTHGRGVKQSYEQAFHHHLKASEAGLPVALYNVGGHYFAGKGVELSFKKAADYYQQAADMGFAPAQVNLGNMYYNGLGVLKSRQRAKELYQLAADVDTNAKLLLEELEIEEKDGGGSDSSSKS